MSTTNLSNPESLEVLTAMLNQTLIETGRFFRSEGSLQSKAQLKRALPPAHEKFQSALDDLSEQIFVAKAFLERDYEAIRARKAALRRRPAVDVAKAETKATGGLQPVSAPGQTGAAASNEAESKSINNGIEAGQQTDSNSHHTGTANAPAKGEKPRGPDAGPPPPAQDAGETEDISFDTLLNNQGSNDFDINLDFRNDNSNTGNDNFFNSNLGDANASNGLDGENNQLGNTESGHTNRELPTGGDAFDLELQKLSGDSNEQFGNNTEDIMGPGESSFDDLFMESENMGGNESGEQDLLGGDGLMQISELDDSWFT
ncbi:hypothetical protein BJX61DRAFT_163333 [Aspergillus egyptiacus]|nr:hypothetical protein BJX61DRAFT_163333 [Aspergillus egyptiacus]